MCTLTTCLCCMTRARMTVLDGVAHRSMNARNQDGVIDFQEFAIINHRYPLVFYPAFRMQLALQEFTLGT
jgi:hypothetical protein